VVHEINGPLIIVCGNFSNTIEHPFLGTIAAGTASLEYFWTDRLYNVFELSEPSGRFRGFYCNLALPAQFDGATLSYVDLDIDIAVAPDSSIRILDEDEFGENSRHLSYPADLITCVRNSVKELERLILARQFPFDRLLASEIHEKT
jgi:protein associated with RNAse G/E